MSERGQIIILIWGLVFMYIFGFTMYFLLNFMPPPGAFLSAAEVVEFYTANEFQIRLGAMVSSWTSAFMVPFAVVAAIQTARLEWNAEKRFPAWSVLALGGGLLMSMFLVFPAICWGVAAFTVDRAPDATLLMHELGTLTLTTTDQFYIFQMIAIAYVSLSRPGDKNTAFPRWLGWFTLWAAIAFEVGAFAFMTKTGPFAWHGILVFWMPLVVFGAWVTVTSIVMIQALRRQMQEPDWTASKA